MRIIKFFIVLLLLTGCTQYEKAYETTAEIISINNKIFDITKTIGENLEGQEFDTRITLGLKVDTTVIRDRYYSDFFAFEATIPFSNLVLFKDYKELPVFVKYSDISIIGNHFYIVFGNRELYNNAVHSKMTPFKNLKDREFKTDEDEKY